MKFSWSHKLFFRINRQIGRHALLDRFMVFCAKWVILCLAIEYVLWGWRYGWQFFWVSLASFALCFFVSYGIALLYRHERPVKEFPGIRELIQPIGTWKSFPSDHTMAAALFLLMEWSTGMYAAYPALFLVGTLAAALVMVSRVYVGVHYPRDILGGIVFAIVSFLVISYFL